jgi:uncharacterized protein
VSETFADWSTLDRRLLWVTSTLTVVELPRALRRTEPALFADVPATVARVACFEIEEVVRAAAAAVPDRNLRPLDAIHLATARGVFGGQLSAFVSYD